MGKIDYVKSSGYRMRVLKSLEAYPKMPSEILKDAEIYQNHISNTLRQLREHGLVECINPEVKKGRLYRLTDEGERISGKLDDEGLR